MLKMSELKKVSSFNNLSKNDFKKLAEVVNKVSYPEDEVLFQKQETSDYFYFIKEGELELEGIDLYRSNKVSNVLELANCDLLAFDNARFNQLIAQSPDCGIKILNGVTRSLCHLLRELYERYADLLNFMIEGDFYSSRRFRVPIVEGIPDLELTKDKRMIQAREQDLYDVPLFKDLTGAERARVASMMKGCKYRVEDFVFHESVHDQNLYIVQDGVIKISKALHQDKMATLSLLKEGKTFGMLSFLSEKKEHNTSAQAVRDSYILIVNKPEFEEFKQQEPRCCLKIMKNICQETYERLNKIEQDFNYVSTYIWKIDPSN